MTLKPTDRLRALVNTSGVTEQFKKAAGEHSDLFAASLMELVANDSYLQNCDPRRIITEALKAATLRLPVSKQLGQAWIIPYNNIPQFQIGYKGWIQLALRTGHYRRLHATPIYEGMEIEIDYYTGDIRPTGKPASKVEIGYFGRLELLNGFSHEIYMTKDEMVAYAERYSPAYTGKNRLKSRWHIDFTAMALKTVTKQNISHWGYVSIEMARAFVWDSGEEESYGTTPTMHAEMEVEVVQDEKPEPKKKSKKSTALPAPPKADKADKAPDVPPEDFEDDVPY